jgi:hypothetical protein
LRRGETTKLFRSPPAGALGVVAGMLESMANSKADEQNRWLRRGAEAAWSAQLDRLHGLIPAWTGNKAQVVELTTNEMFEQRRRGVTLLDEVERDGIALIEYPFTRLQLQGS